MTKTNPALETALALCRAGFALLPLKGKAPHTALLPPGEDGKPSTAALATSPANEQTVAAWFAAARGLNIGLFTGVGDHAPLVVDLDPAKCKDPERRAVLEARSELAPGVGLPPTGVQVISGSGGRHLYYAHPGPQIRPVTRVGHRAGTFVDVQADHRYVVLPPSTHPDTGKQYQWVDDDDRVLPLAEVVERLTRLADAPQWCIRSEADDRGPPEAPRIQAGQWLTEMWSLDVPEGGLPGSSGRKQCLRSMAQYLAQREYPCDAADAMLQTWNAARCRPPLDAREVTRLTSHIYTKVAEDNAMSVADRVSLRNRGPKWPHDLFLGTRFGRFVRAASGRANSDLVAVAALGGLGMASTGAYRLHYLEPGIEMNDRHWVAPSALWVLPAIESGEGKSIVARDLYPMLDATQPYLAQFAGMYNAERDDLLAELETEKKDLKTCADREQARELRQEITRRIADIPPELGERWLLSDATPESFLNELAKTAFMGLISDEGEETITKFFGHYSGNADMNGVLKSWDGGVTRQSRIGRGYTEIRGLCSILTLVQPTTLRKLSTVDAEDRGLMARFLFSVPHPEAERFEPYEKAEGARYFSEFENSLRAIFYGGTHAAETAADRARQYRPEYSRDPERAGATSLDLVGDEVLTRPDVRGVTDVIFRGECVEALKVLEADLRELSSEGGEHYLARAWTRKAHEHAMRIAAVLQLSESPPRDHEEIVMEAKWVQRAIALVRDYFLPHYYCASDLISQPPLANKGLHILAHFGGRDSFTLGEAATFIHARTPDVRPVVEWLERVGAVRTKRVGRSLEIYPIAAVDY